MTTNAPAVPHDRPQMSLLLRTALAFVGVGLLATVSVAAVAYFLYSNALQREGYARLDAARILLQEPVQAHLNHLKSDAESLGVLPSVIRLTLSRRSESAGVAPNELTLIHNTLEDHVRRMGYHDIYVLDPEGKVLYTSRQPNRPQDVQTGSENEPSPLAMVYTTVQEKVLPVVLATKSGVPRESDSLSAAAILAAAPIRQVSGSQILGYLVTESSFEVLHDVLAFGGSPLQAGLGRTGRAYLVDRTQALRSPLNGLSPGSTISSDGVRAALAGSIGNKSYIGPKGQRVLAAYGPLQEDGMDWVLMVEQSQSEAMTPARQAALYTGLVALLLVIVIAIFGSLFSQHISRPILALRETIDRVATGDETSRAKPAGPAEIASLATSLNQMIEDRNAAKELISTENKRLQANIQNLLVVAADASDGKLFVRAQKPEGVLGNVADALNRMLEDFSLLIGEAKNASARIDEAAAGIAAAAEELTAGSELQTDKLGSTIQEVQRVTADAQTVSNNASETSKAADQTRSAAEQGVDTATQLLAFMEQIRRNFQNYSEKIKRLGDRSTEISGIVKSISEISAETDVLAMNASIEAARAGEQGKGFTVVADQVRALADRTRDATAEIEKLVLGIQSETADAVQQMASQTREVENGTRQITEAQSSLALIVESSVDSSTLAAQINQSASEQEERARSMLDAVMAINGIALEARERTLQFRETSAQLASLSLELNQQLNNFDIEATGAPAQPDATV